MKLRGIPKLISNNPFLSFENPCSAHTCFTCNHFTNTLYVHICMHRHQALIFASARCHTLLPVDFLHVKKHHVDFARMFVN